jgi:cytochrome d ubiquinol oxidase subunit I
MGATVIADRVHFAALIMFHYLFPPVTIGLGVLIAVLKVLQLRSREDYDGRYARAARFWGRLFVLNFGAGVATGIPMEFQFGTNWARFSNASGGVIGQGLMMEGLFAFFLESVFLGLFLFGERRVTPLVHTVSAVMVSLGSIISAYFITATDAWMQHPVGYVMGTNGVLRLTSLSAVLTNPFEVWEYLHTVNGAFVHGAMVMGALGAFYLLARRHIEFARISLSVSLVFGLIFSLTQVFPTGSKNGEAVVKYQLTTLAAMEGQFKSEPGAPLAIIGMPDTEKGNLLDPVEVPGLLSYLAYGNFTAPIKGLNDIPRNLWPPVEIVYYAYHIMITLGGYFIGLMALGVFLLWRRKLETARWYLWLLMLSLPFPYIANEAGWVVTCVGRQPWIIYGVMRTAAANSTNVSSGEAIFTLLGFVGIYILLGLLFLFLVGKTVAEGPEEPGNPVPTTPAPREEVTA